VGERADYVSTSHVRADSGSGGASDSGSDSDPDAIAADIEQTREEMSGTIEAIQERLDPQQLSQQATEVTEQAREAAKDVAKYAIEEAKAAVNEVTSQAKASVREATIGRVEHMAMYTRDTAESVRGDLWTTIKSNPVPAALAAIGIGWLWSNRSGGGSQRGSYARSGNYRGETHSDWSYQSSGADRPTTVRTGPRVATLRPGPSVAMGPLVPTVANLTSRAGRVSRWAASSSARPRSEWVRCRKWPARLRAKPVRSSARLAKSSARCRTRCASGPVRCSSRPRDSGRC
jgi:hypothetical protein